MGGETSDPGASRVKYRGGNIAGHFLTKDFFITMVSLDVWVIFLLTVSLFLADRRRTILSS